MQVLRLTAWMIRLVTGIRQQAQQLVANSLGQYGNDVEVVFCNNDAMALGALQAIEAAGRTVGEDIYLVGVDALTEALENVLAGNDDRYCTERPHSHRLTAQQMQLSTT